MMEDSAFVMLAITVGAAVLFTPVLAIWALVRTYRDNDVVATLRSQLHGLRQDLTQIRIDLGLDPEPSPEPERVETPVVAPMPETPIVPEAPTAEPQPRPEQVAPPAPPPRDRASIEDRLASRWLVWIGAAAIALGAVFLVKYSVERGLLGPAVRVILGGLFGMALVAAGEWLRRRPLQRAIAAVRPDYVPMALTAAGLFAAFASVYAASAFHGFLSPVAAFPLLAAIAFAAVALSVIQGRFVALLGVLGGFITPMLVPTETPSAWALFTYLTVLTGAAAFTAHYRSWPWLKWAALSGATSWPLLWFVTSWTRQHTDALGVYLIALAVVFLVVHELARRARGDAEADPPRLDQHIHAVAGIVACLTFILLRMDGYGAFSVAVLVAVGVLYMAAGRRDATLDLLPAIAGVLTVVSMAAWHLPKILVERPQLGVFEAPRYGLDPGYVLPPDISTFVGMTVVMALLFGLAGFGAMWGARRPARWAALSAAMPVVLLAIAYWRVTAFEIDLAWGTSAVLVAAVLVGAATYIRPHQYRTGFQDSLGLFAAAAVAAISLAVAMLLREAWLTVALAVELPALAWIHAQMRLTSLRRVAFIVAGIVLVRLVINWNIVDYPLGSVPFFNWLLYGYGLPALAFFAAARMFKRTRDDMLVQLLEAGAIIFAVLLISLEIRTVVPGAINAPSYTLLEQALHTAAWLAVAYGLTVRNRVARRPVAHWAAHVLLGGAALQLVFGALLVSNPLWSDESVGTTPVLNLLLLAYGVPAAVALLFALEFRRDGNRTLAMTAGIASLVLLFVNVTLEVTHLFQGEFLSSGAVSDAEWYAYSAAWLIFAIALLVAAMKTGAAALRYASLVLILLTVAKVFLSDMEALDGLWRVASFFALGLCLVAIGFAYQRWIFPPARPAPGPANPTPAEVT